MRFAGRIDPGSGAGPLGHLSIILVPERIAASSEKLSAGVRALSSPTARAVSFVPATFFRVESGAVFFAVVSTTLPMLPLAESWRAVESGVACDDASCIGPQAAVALATMSTRLRPH